MISTVRDNSKYKTCDLCGFTTDDDEDVVAFGDWMRRSGITVHYFCLLLSTNLPQRGDDNRGILGFLMRDIRLEINNAKARKCIYCDQISASISCFKCRKYFHLVCGHSYHCSFQFIGEFRSYCNECVPLDEIQLRTKQDPPVGIRCYICKERMGKYNPIEWIYAPCCKNGYAHRLCLRRYALTAGYYVICIWCQSTAFRNDIRLQGVFVPDRDARWEQKNAYADLHRGHNTCNMDVCNCPKGRDYVTGVNWPIIVCSLCGSFGAHNPACIPGSACKKKKVESFTCDTCLRTIEYRSNTTVLQHDINSAHQGYCRDFVVDYQLQMKKMPTTQAPNAPPPLHETPQFSEDDSLSFASSVTTVRARYSNSIMKLKNKTDSSDESMQVDDGSPNKTVVSLEEISQNLEVDQNQPQGKIMGPCEKTLSVSGIQNSNRISDTYCMEPTTKSAQIYIVEDWPEFDEQFNVLRTCKVRIDLNSPRFQGKTIDDIVTFEGMSLITDADKFEHTNGPGIFKKIDDAIAETLQLFEKEPSATKSLGKTEESFKALKKSCMKDNESETQQRKNDTTKTQTIVAKEINSSENAQIVAIEDEQLQVNQSQIEFQGLETSAALHTQEPNTNSAEITLEPVPGTLPIYIVEDWPAFDDQFNVLSTCKVRIDLNSPRFHGKTIDDIVTFEGMSLITDADKFDHTNGPGVFKRIDEAIAENLQSTEKEPNCAKAKDTSDKSSKTHKKMFVNNESGTQRNKNETEKNQKILAQEIRSADNTQIVAIEDEQSQLNQSETESLGQEIPSILVTQESHANSAEISLESIPGTRPIYIVEDWPEFDDELNVLSTCKVRIDLNSPRFQGKIIDEIVTFEGMSLITDADKFEHTSGPGIFKIIDDAIADTLELFEKETNQCRNKKSNY